MNNINRRAFGMGMLATVGAVTLNRFSAQSQQEPNGRDAGATALLVNGPRIIDHLNALAEFGKNPQGGVSRVAYSDADLRGREYVMGLMRAARLDVSIDAAGNISGRRDGRINNLPALLIGSHIDSVPEGGHYDGVVQFNPPSVTLLPLPSRL